MNNWDEDALPLLTLPPPDIAVLHLSNLDEVLAAHACTDSSCLLGQRQLPLAPPCGHLDIIWTWHAQGRLWLVCARCDARRTVAVRWGERLRGYDEEESETTPCGHWPYGMVLYENGWLKVYCLECQTRWSAWEVAAYVPDGPA